jgi:hypothetical protein
LAHALSDTVLLGCFPGNWNACGPAPVPDAAFLALRMADDASDADDALVTDAALDASVDAADAPGSSDANGDTCRDGSHDGSPWDVSIDGTEPDAAEDVGSEPQPDATEDAPEDAPEDADAGQPPRDAGPPPTDAGGRPDAPTDIGSSDEPKIVQGCYIRPAVTGGVLTEGAPLGLGEEGVACNDSRDCGGLMACVEVDQKAVCRFVYCQLPPECLKGRYYQEAPLRANSVTRRDLNVPICLPVDNCVLLASPKSCPAGKVCAVVGSDGDTTCMQPGPKKVGEQCDETSRCEEGLLCSRFVNQCVKICHVEAPSD